MSVEVTVVVRIAASVATIVVKTAAKDVVTAEMRSVVKTAVKDEAKAISRSVVTAAVRSAVTTVNIVVIAGLTAVVTTEEIMQVRRSRMVSL